MSADIQSVLSTVRKPDVRLVGKLSPVIPVHDWNRSDYLPRWAMDLAASHVVHALFRINGRRYWLALCVQGPDPDDCWYPADFVAAEGLDLPMPYAFGDVMQTLTTAERNRVIEIVDAEINRGAVWRDG